MKNTFALFAISLTFICGQSKAEIVKIISGQDAREEIVTYKTTCFKVIYELQIDKKAGTIIYSGTTSNNDPSFKVDISKSEIAKFFLDRSFFGNVSTWCGAGLSIDYRGFQVKQNIPSRGFHFKGAILPDGRVEQDKKFTDLPAEVSE